ncbi:MAG: lysophospholipid acyltransferase family protein [Bacteroidales bacterium]|nr:lysophospholipid acyltransferase family protein [Bacteroidales bacterium]
MLTLFYFILFIVSILLIAIQPWQLLYKYSDAVAYILQRVFKYRVKVTRNNLKLAFPEKSEEEIQNLENSVYKNLADISVEALKGFSMLNRQVKARHKIVNPELLDKYYRNGQSIIGVAGHINNWEWGAMSAGLQLKHYPIAIYKPMSNKLIDWFMKWNRSVRGTMLCPTSSTFETFQQYQTATCLYILVADQSPSDLTKAHWINFFGQETACIHGPEKYAKLYNYPVFFIDIQRIKRGFYEIEISPLAENPATLKEGELTQKYMQKLEEVIRKNPECWLWTHRRWKRKKTSHPSESN